MNFLQPFSIPFISRRDHYTASTRENDLQGGPYSANQHSTLTVQTAEQDTAVLCQQPEKTIRTSERDAMTSQIRKEQHVGARALIIYTILSLLSQPFSAGVTGPL